MALMGVDTSRLYLITSRSAGPLAGLASCLLCCNTTSIRLSACRSADHLLIACRRAR